MASDMLTAYKLGWKTSYYQNTYDFKGEEEDVQPAGLSAAVDEDEGEDVELPEELISGREKVYLSWFYKTFAYKPNCITQKDIEEYLRTYKQPGALRAGFSYYRAMGQDAEDNSKVIANLKLPMPVLAIGGEVSYPNGRGRGKDPEASLRRVALNVRGEVFPECGHFIPEEAPELLLDRMKLFFNDNF